MPNTLSNSTPASAVSNPDWIALVREKLVVHDGRVTQIERTEKTRIPSPRDQAVE